MSEQTEARRQVAERIVNDLQNGPHGVVFHTTRAFKSNPNIAHSLADAIEAALKDRDERAAKIAHAKATEYRVASDAAEKIQNNQPNLWAIRARTASTIAAAIETESKDA